MVFEVALPPGSEHGPAVDRPALRKAGLVSSQAFRIGLAVPTLTWIPGLMRRPRRGQVGDGGRAGCGSVLEYLRGNEEAC